MEARPKIEKVSAESLLSRFRSKEDLYRYMVHQGKCSTMLKASSIAKVFLPTMGGTRLSFMRDILSETKQHLKQNEVI